MIRKQLCLVVMVGLFSPFAPDMGFAEEMRLPGYYVPSGNLSWAAATNAIHGGFNVLVWRDGTSYTIPSDAFPGYKITSIEISASLDQLGRSVYVRIPLRKLGNGLEDRQFTGIARISDRGVFSYYLFPYEEEDVPEKVLAVRAAR